MLAWLTESGCTHMAMEATDAVYWQPAWNILSDGAFELINIEAATAQMAFFGTCLPPRRRKCAL